jgi:DNA-binding response OmpR family regulator
MDVDPHRHKGSRSKARPGPSQANIVILSDKSVFDTDRIRAALEEGSVVLIAHSTGSSGRLDLTIDESIDVPPTLMVVGRLELDLDARWARSEGQDLHLTEQELRILNALARRPGKAISFDELALAAWNVKTFGHSDAIRSAIKRMRRKLARVNAGIDLESVRGFGFRLSLQTGLE